MKHVVNQYEQHMENPRILDGAGARIVRRSQVLGALTGGVLTAAVLLLIRVHGRSWWTTWLLQAFGLAMAPANALCLLFGRDLDQVDDGNQMLLAVALNTLLLLAVGTLLGLLVAFRKRAGAASRKPT